MSQRRQLLAAGILFAMPIMVAGCSGGPSAIGNFDRTFDVTAPARLDLSNASGDVEISGSIDNRVHVYASVRASGFGFENPQKRVDSVTSYPPLEQKGDAVLIGKDFARIRNVTITYKIQVPRDTEVITTLGSGAQTIRDIRGPVRAQAASGSIRVDRIDLDTQLTTTSGSITATDVGAETRISSASGSVKIIKTKGDVRVNILAGSIEIANPGGRVEADSTNGSIDIRNASRDVSLHAVSGSLSLSGNPSANSYWDLKTSSGSVDVSVPSNSSFRLSADAVTGEIKTDIPIIIEEQQKHSLRAHVGTGGGRIGIRTVSGSIRVSGAN